MADKVGVAATISSDCTEKNMQENAITSSYFQQTRASRPALGGRLPSIYTVRQKEQKGHCTVREIVMRAMPPRHAAAPISA